MNRIKLAIHNILCHPLMELCYIFQLRSLGNYIHNDLIKIEGKEYSQLVAIHEGGDWSDASAEYLIKIVDVPLIKMLEEYEDDLYLYKSIKHGMQFSEWLVYKKYCIINKEIEIFYPNN